MSNYRHIPPEEERHQDELREAERLGRVAAHHRKSLGECPYAETDLRRARWVAGFDAARKKANRGDMTPARAEGFRAFQDGLTERECHMPLTSTERTEWMQGWDQAKRAKEKHDELYR